MPANYAPRTLVDAYETWWKGSNDRPVVHYRYPPGNAPHVPKPDWLPLPLHPDWGAAAKALDVAKTAEDPQRILREFLDYAQPALADEAFLAEGFPRILPNFGPGVLAAMISDYSQFRDTTTWFELGRDRPAMSLEKIARARIREDNLHARLVERFLQALAERFAGQRLVCMTDLGGALDLLAALRTSNALLMDLIESPRSVNEAMENVDRLWIETFAHFDALCSQANQGLRGCWMQLLSPCPFYPLQCDFGAMISPEMFRDFVTPSLQRCAGAMGRAIFHLDGPGMVPHLPHVTCVEEIRAVQWTPGAGQGDVDDPQWHELYRSVIDAGRKVILLCYPPEPDKLRRLFAALPAESFYLLIEGPDRSTGERVLAAID
jgi:5-methyltetrahydrofolate--homocysteine methyltransferase